MTTHKRDNLVPNTPVCKELLKGDSLEVDIDSVDCVYCLRMLAKDAVLYGVGRRAGRRKW